MSQRSQRGNCIGQWIDTPYQRTHTMSMESASPTSRTHRVNPHNPAQTRCGLPASSVRIYKKASYTSCRICSAPHAIRGPQISK